MKNPAVLLYTSDFITGTLFMTNEEVGAYIRVLCMQHQKGHLTKEEIEQICKNENVFKSVIIHFKQDKNNLFFNERMDLEKEKRTKYSESRANNRKKKEETKKTYEKDMKNISKSYEKHMENENENINININNNINNKYKYFNNKELEDIFIEFLNVRKKLKAVNSDRAIKMLLNKLSNYSDEVKYKMIEQSIIKSWKDVYEVKDIEPEWMNKEIKEEVNQDAKEFAERIRKYHREQKESQT